MLLMAVLLVCAVFAFAGCNNNTEATTTAAENTTTAAAENTSVGGEEKQTRTIVDMAGAEVEIPMEVKTIIDSWPAHNSVMLLIGAGDLLVGTTTATINNAWSSLLYPNIVNIPADFANLEDVLKVNPDLYVCNNADTAAQARAAGIPAVVLSFSDYDNMKQSFTILGEILGGEYQTKLQNWCDYVENWTATITDTLKDVPESERPVLYYNSAQQSGDVTAGFSSPSICKSWANICGTVYMNDLMKDPSVSTFSAEELLEMDPDIIVVGGIKQAEAWDKLNNDKVWSDMSAVKNGDIYLAPMGIFSWCRFGMESAMMLPWLASNVYPEKFENINIREIVFDFYKDFAGVELTDAQIENMLVGYGPHDPYGASAVGK